MNHTKGWLIAFFALCFAMPGLPDNDPARDCLARHGWQIEREEPSRVLEVPDPVTGLPWAHYQQFSLDCGYDLSAVAGQQIQVREFLLTKRTERSNAELRAAVVVHEGRVVGGWIHTKANVPGIYSLYDQEFPSEI